MSSIRLVYANRSAQADQDIFLDAFDDIQIVTGGDADTMTNLDARIAFLWKKAESEMTLAEARSLLVQINKMLSYLRSGTRRGTRGRDRRGLRTLREQIVTKYGLPSGNSL